MKKLTFLLILISTNLLSQENVDFVKEDISFLTKNKLSVQIGVGQPLGAIASNDFGSEESGYGGNGVNVGIHYEHYTNPFIAFTANFNSMRFKFGSEALARDFEDNNGNISVSVSSDDYIYNTYAVGIKTSVGNDFVKIYFNPVIGYSILRFPERSIYIKEGSQNTELIYQKTEDSQLMYGVNFGSDIRASKVISFSFNFGYYSSSDFLMEETIDQNQNGFSFGAIQVSNEFSFAAISSSVSLGFNF